MYSKGMYLHTLGSEVRQIFCLFEKKLLFNLSQAPSIFFRENRYDSKEENEQFNDFENGT